MIATLYSGHVYIWSYETQQVVKTFELTDVPVRAGRFIARKNWIVCGSDDLYAPLGCCVLWMEELTLPRQPNPGIQLQHKREDCFV